MPLPAVALDRVETRDEFLQSLDGRDLVIRLYGLRLTVKPDGRITGRAAGRDVAGAWTWLDGFFCRDMTWGQRDIPYNCQLVTADAGTMRFQSDRGAGDAADFRLVN